MLGVAWDIPWECLGGLLYGGFLKYEDPQLTHFNGIFHEINHPFEGTPMTMETPMTRCWLFLTAPGSHTIGLNTEIISRKTIWWAREALDQKTANATIEQWVHLL